MDEPRLTYTPGTAARLLAELESARQRNDELAADLVLRSDQRDRLLAENNRLRRDLDDLRLELDAQREETRRMVLLTVRS